MNNISFVSIPLLLLYEHRHLFTDDSQYNSLLLSSLIQKDIELIHIKLYSVLELSDKIELHEKYEISSIYFFNGKGIIKCNYIQNYHKKHESYTINVFYGWYEWDKIKFQYDDKRNLMIKGSQ